MDDATTQPSPAELAAAARAYFDARDAEAAGPAACTMMRIVLDSTRGHVEQADERGVLMRLDCPGSQWLMDACDPERAAQLAALCTGERGRVVVSLMDAACATLLGASEQDVFRCNTYVYLGGPVPGVAPQEDGPTRVGGLELRRLDESFCELICAHYKPLPPEAVLDHLQRGWVFGAFDEQGELAGFIGEHTEGTIGMLEVLPAHRRRGCATALETFMINRHLAQSRTPYCQVEVSNAASHALQAKLGFTRLPGTQCWVEG